LIGLECGHARDLLNRSGLGVDDEHGAIRPAGDDSATISTRDERVQCMASREYCRRLRTTLDGLQQSGARLRRRVEALGLGGEKQRAIPPVFA
jgi:hypothetical protein